MIIRILEYTDVISYRNGKYIDRIKKNDDRYYLLNTIPKKKYDITYMNYYVYLPIDGIKDKYLYMSSEINNNNFYINLIKYNWHEASIYVENEGDLDGYNITNAIEYQIV